MKREKELQMQEGRVPAIESETREQEETMYVEAEAQSPAFSMMTGM